MFAPKDETFLTTRELAKRWRMSPGTLTNWRSMKPPRGPKWIKFGKQCLYPLSAVKAFEKIYTSNIGG